MLAVVSDRKFGQQLYGYTANTSGTGTHTYNTLANEYVYVASGGNFDQTSNTNETSYDVYLPEVLSFSDYYPFLMKMPGRNNNSAGYRYQGQGQEEDNEFTEGMLSFEYRVHDPRIGRFLSVDPLTNKFPFWTPYSFSGNQVIQMREFEGLEPSAANFQLSQGHTATATFTRLNDEWTSGVTKIALFTAIPLIFADILITKGQITTLICVELLAAQSAQNYVETNQQAYDQFGDGPFIIPVITAPSSIAKGAFSDDALQSLKNQVKSTDDMAGVFTVTDDMSNLQKSTVRSNFARAKMGDNAYTRYNGDKSIDLTKPVKEITHGPSTLGKRLVQYREPSRTDASPFFTYDDVDPATLGIPSSYTEKFYVELDKEYNFLQSTAGDVPAFKKGEVGTYKGGGTQLYSEEAAKNATFTPAK